MQMSQIDFTGMENGEIMGICISFILRRPMAGLGLA